MNIVTSHTEPVLDSPFVAWLTGVTLVGVAFLGLFTIAFAIA